jgi:hypothetical protein
MQVVCHGLTFVPWETNVPTPRPNCRKNPCERSYFAVRTSTGTSEMHRNCCPMLTKGNITSGYLRTGIPQAFWTRSSTSRAFARARFAPSTSTSRM